MILTVHPKYHESNAYSSSWLVLNVINVLIALAVLIMAMVLDLVLGDPSPNYPDKWVFRLHPTVLMGKFTKKIEPYFKSPDQKIEKLLGVFLALVVICAFTFPVYLGLWAIYTYINIFLYAFIGIILLKMTICIKLETDWAKAVANSIKADNLDEARKYSHFSRRDSKSLNGSQISSAVIESMAENLIDFKLSPILSFALFGVTGAVAFRAINTLDGTVGFKDKEHINTGWFSANLDTVVNYIPTRFASLLMIAAAAILGKDAKNAWKIARRDHAKTPSRNHGWPMATMAGALRVQLEKPGHYVLGDNLEPLAADKILGALRIRDATIVLWAVLCIITLVAVRLCFLPF